MVEDTEVDQRPPVAEAAQDVTVPAESFDEEVLRECRELATRRKQEAGSIGQANCWEELRLAILAAQEIV